MFKAANRQLQLTRTMTMLAAVLATVFILGVVVIEVSADLLRDEDISGAPHDFVLPREDEFPQLVYDIHLNFQRPLLAHQANMPNITLVSHATYDRLDAVVRWCESYQGPMSISIFIRTQIDDMERTMRAFTSNPCLAQHAALHRVSEPGHYFNLTATKYVDGGKAMHTHYPFNVQRNAALDGCVGDLALLMDIDFHLMPVPNNREVDLRRHHAQQREQAARWPFFQDDDRQDDAPSIVEAALFVIPAVETVVKLMDLPTNMAELQNLIDAHAACPFYGHHCKHCHHPTNLRKFLQLGKSVRTPLQQQQQGVDDDDGEKSQVAAASPVVVLSPYLIDYEEGYEPYVIVNRSSFIAAPRCNSEGGDDAGEGEDREGEKSELLLSFSESKRTDTNNNSRSSFPFPRFDDHFVGRGKDKLSFFYETAIGQHRPFIVMAPPMFIVHAGRGDHPSDPGEGYSVRQLQNKRLYLELKERVRSEYSCYDPSSSALHRSASVSHSSLPLSESEGQGNNEL